ncbi:MAG: hypothetical protein HQK51_06010 [Oligoflexia bacterium]|nr:hypothetical protein [Oligoflexia bacterium]
MNIIKIRVKIIILFTIILLISVNVFATQEKVSSVELDESKTEKSKRSKLILDSVQLTDTSLSKLYASTNFSREQEQRPGDDGCFDSVNLSTTTGKAIVADLFSSQKSISTTSLRKEYKSTLKVTDWEKIFEILQSGDEKGASPLIKLTLRDVPALHSKNYTFTFYGKNASFQNGSVQSKIKLRARFYLEETDRALLRTGKQLKAVERSKTTANTGWLEIKIQNPSEKALLAVNKYRIMLSDKDIIKLFNLDSKNENFAKELDEIREHATKFSQNDSTLVTSMFDTVKKIALEDAAFLVPHKAISYQRFSYQYDEINEKGEKFNHQITVDKDVTFHTPKMLGKRKQSRIKMEDFIYHPESTMIARYKPQIVAVEYKDPHSFAQSAVSGMTAMPARSTGSRDHADAEDSKKDETQKKEVITPVQEVFIQKLLTPMKEYVVDGFQSNRGKSFHLHKILQ